MMLFLKPVHKEKNWQCSCETTYPKGHNNNFIRQLTKEGCYLHRHGKKHDIYINPKNGHKVPVPRHAEIKEMFCKVIKKQLGLK